MERNPQEKRKPNEECYKKDKTVIMTHDKCSNPRKFPPVISHSVSSCSSDQQIRDTGNCRLYKISNKTESRIGKEGNTERNTEKKVDRLTEKLTSINKQQIRRK